MSRPRYFLLAIHTAVTFLLSSPLLAEEWQAGIQDSGAHSASISTKARSATHSTSGRIALVCFPDRRAGVYVEAEIVQASRLSDFRFKDFEGPEAPYGEKELATLRLKSGDAAFVIISSGAGWYIDGDTFKVSIALNDLAPKEKAKVFGALRGKLTAVEVSLREEKNPGSTVTLTALGSWDTAPLRKVLSECE